jgi:hypothetical protein
MNWRRWLSWWRPRVDPPAVFEGRKALFQQERPRLQKLFFDTAAASGKPRGLRWKECQFNDMIEWVREKATGRLHALVGVTISFEAIEGGDMEGVEAVGNLRNATAVFFFQDGEWKTAGRVVFNLNPDEAVAHFKDGYERVID